MFEELVLEMELVAKPKPTGSKKVELDFVVYERTCWLTAEMYTENFSSKLADNNFVKM